MALQRLFAVMFLMGALCGGCCSTLNAWFTTEQVVVFTILCGSISISTAIVMHLIILRTEERIIDLMDDCNSKFTKRVEKIQEQFLTNVRPTTSSMPDRKDHCEDSYNSETDSDFEPEEDSRGSQDSDDDSIESDTSDSPRLNLSQKSETPNSVLERRDEDENDLSTPSKRCQHPGCKMWCHTPDKLCESF